MQVVIKLAEHDLSVSALSALRFGIAALCFAPAAVRGLQNKEMRLTALELGMWLFGAFLLPLEPNPTGLKNESRDYSGHGPSGIDFSASPLGHAGYV